MKKDDFIFVYGTLRRGERADLAREAHSFGVTYIGEDEVNGLIYNIGSFPGAKIPYTKDFDSAAPIIKGEVFLVRHESICAFLDAYEGYPNLYNRSEVKTRSGKTAWIYTFNHSVSESDLIESGDWKARINTVKAMVAA